MPKRRPFFRRRRLLVRPFQVRFVATSLAWFASMLLVMATVVFLPLILELRSDPSSHGTLEAANAILALHDVFWPWMGLLLLLFAVHITLLSHRVAGPLARFHAVFRAIQSGSVGERIRLRKHDYLHEEAAAFNAALDAIRRRHGELGERAEGVEAQLEKLRSSVGPEAEATRSQLTRVLGDVKQLRAEIERLQVESTTSPPYEPPTTTSSPPVNALPAGSGGSQRGFTLIEILLVCMIMATIAGIAIPAYAEAVNSARIAKAISDVRAHGHSIQFHYILTGALPATLAEAGVTVLNDPWGRPYQYLPFPAGNPKIAGSRKDHNLVPINSDFDLYSMGRDGASVPPLTAAPSRDDIVRANDGSFIGLASTF